MAQLYSLDGHIFFVSPLVFDECFLERESRDISLLVDFADGEYSEAWSKFVRVALSDRENLVLEREF